MIRVLVLLALCMGCADAVAQSNDADVAGSIQSIGANPPPGGPQSTEIEGLPAWVSILPPLVAIVLALAFRHVLLALVLGVWLGSFLLTDLSLVGSFARLLDHHIVGSVANRGHASILVFSLLLGGMLGLITANGGARGLASWVRTDRGTRRRGQLTTWFLGLIIFFDDYANALLVGSSMRPVTDRLRISREKLAFLVDATAAPVSSLALISSWIAVEVGYIEDQFVHLGIERDAYVTFVETIPYRFYPLLMILFVAWVAFRGRDFGPMLAAERRAVEEGRLLRPGATPASDFHDEEVPEDVVARPWNAVVPVAVVVAVAAIGIYVDGQAKVLTEGLEPSLRTIVSEASSSAALLWASGAGCLAAFGMSLASRALGVGSALDAWLSGVRGMMLAALI
ncbi:MAG: Na+/H+ antiporter NhaC family protein, partial [Polyangiales bacterium]